MLQITIPPREFWDEKNEVFINFKGQTLTLEHSLVSLSKWEAKWHKPFLSKDTKTTEETFDYIKCMTLTQNVSDEVYNYLTVDNLKRVNAYIEDPMTATTITEHNPQRGGRGETVTSELIYYWMIALQIPFECQKWHINRLLTLIRVCNIKNQPPKKHSQREIMSRNAALNAARRKQFNTTG